MQVTKELIGSKLREERSKPPKISQAQAAELSGVRLRSWTEYEAGRVMPPLDALAKFADARGISLATFIAGPQSELQPAPPVESDERDIPILDHIPAGPLTLGFGEENILGHVRSFVKDPHAFSLIVNGSSMSPEIQEGDEVICSPSAPFISGRVYAVVTMEGEQSLKKVRRDERSKSYVLIPGNKEFPTLHLPEEQVLKLVRVVEVRRDLQ